MTMVSIIWLIWFMHQFLCLIILLNFLIAVVSQSYDEVMSKAILMKFKNMIDMNGECLSSEISIPFMNKILVFTV